jgi:hypothetical protein
VVRSCSAVIIYPFAISQAILDTCHSDTMLDLPHYHCNNIYVPWLSKDIRSSNATLPGSPLCVDDDVDGASSASRGELYEAWVSKDIRRSKARITGLPLPFDTDFDDALSANQGELSVEADVWGSMSVPSLTRRFISPILRLECDGWCRYDLIPRATVVSIDSPAWCG